MERVHSEAALNKAKAVIAVSGGDKETTVLLTKCCLVGAPKLRGLNQSQVEATLRKTVLTHAGVEVPVEQTADFWRSEEGQEARGKIRARLDELLG